MVKTGVSVMVTPNIQNPHNHQLAEIGETVNGQISGVNITLGLIGDTRIKFAKHNTKIKIKALRSLFFKGDKNDKIFTCALVVNIMFSYLVDKHNQIVKIHHIETDMPNVN